MLIEFSIGNYKSFMETMSFSMVAARLTAKDKRLDKHHVFKVGNDLHLLKSAALYGANASGKSNFIDAIRFMKYFVLSSSKDTQANEQIPVEPFRLSTETANEPSFFEMVFLTDSRRYRYGFEVTSERVVAEWLFHVPAIREAKLFERRDGKFEVTNTFRESKELRDKTRDNALFLSVVAQFNGVISNKLLQWFRNLGLIFGLNDDGLRRYTSRRLYEEKHRDEILHLIRRLDVGIDDIQVHKSPLDDTSNQERIDVLTAHRKFDAQGESMAFEFFDMDNNESEGTKKVFSMAGPLVHTLTNGKVLIIDELDARLHPLITRAIIGLFNSSETNPRNAQLIFATHDTNLLSKDIFRRDQIWFAEKDRFGATHLYSLAEYKVRNDASFESDYIRGKYGAIPFVGDLSTLLVAPDGE